MTHPEQEENLQRVSSKIGEAILDFARIALAKGEPRFHIDALRRFVAERGLIAPDSPGRILRQLRQTKQLDYKVLNRRDSLYELLSIAKPSRCYVCRVCSRSHVVWSPRCVGCAAWNLALVEDVTKVTAS